MVWVWFENGFWYSLSTFLITGGFKFESGEMIIWEGEDLRGDWTYPGVNEMSFDEMMQECGWTSVPGSGWLAWRQLGPPQGLGSKRYAVCPVRFDTLPNRNRKKNRAMTNIAPRRPLSNPTPCSAHVPTVRKWEILVSTVRKWEILVSTVKWAVSNVKIPV